MLELQAGHYLVEHARRACLSMLRGFLHAADSAIIYPVCFNYLALG